MERDGSGDFSTIRPAIEASSPGDTIQLGLGRYTEVEPFSLPGWTEPTYVPVTVDSLVIRGVDRDGVIIGPMAPDFQGFGPKGIVAALEITLLEVENLTIENVREGIYVYSRIHVRDCAIAGCDIGIVGGPVESSIVRCVFSENRDGMHMADGTQDLLIEDCRFVENNLGVSLDLAKNVVIRRCEFRHVEWYSTGIQFATQSIGEVARCLFEGVQTGVALRSSSRAVLSDNRSMGCEESIAVFDGALAEGSGNVFTGSYAAIVMRTYGRAALSGNHIMKSDSLAVWCDGYRNETFDIDLRDNYWGTDSADSIAAWIHDGNDPHGPFDLSTSNVLFEPFSPVPVPTRETSVGGFKAGFRH